MANTIAIEKVGLRTKVSVTDAAGYKNIRYDGQIIAQDANGFTINFPDNSFETYLFDEISEKLGFTNVEDYLDYLNLNGFFIGEDAGGYTDRISGARGCDVLGIGTHNTLNCASAIVREDDTTITGIVLSDGDPANNITEKGFLNIVLQAGELITFEKPLVSITITSGSLMTYFA